MKNKMYYLLLVLMIITFQKKGSAQTYVPFPDSNAIWRQYYHVYQPGFNDLLCKEFQDYIKGDTIINGTTYRNVYSVGNMGFPAASCNIYQFHGPKLAFREDNKRIFFILYTIPPDSTEYILYDFNLGLGDTCIYPEHFTMNTMNIVTIVDSVLVFNSYRKRYFLSAVYPWVPPQVDSNYVAIIEGIGSTYGLLPNLTPNWAELYNELICFRHNGNDYSPWGDPCNYLTTEEAPQPQPEVKIYPNPASGYIAIEDREGYYSDFEIADLTGRIILKENIEGRNPIKRVLLHTVGNGIYLCRITSKVGNLFTSKIVIVK
jgi:hypothetical protein